MKIHPPIKEAIKELCNGKKTETHGKIEIYRNPFKAAVQQVL
jgi:hypothetical protein